MISDTVLSLTERKMSAIDRQVCEVYGPDATCKGKVWKGFKNLRTAVKMPMTNLTQVVYQLPRTVFKKKVASCLAGLKAVTAIFKKTKKKTSTRIPLSFMVQCSTKL